MEIVSDPLGNDDPPRDAVMIIGNFDGVHQGHQLICSQAVERAAELDVKAVAMTFSPHPTKVLRPKKAPKLLATLSQRLQLLDQTGLDAVLVVPFTHKVARVTADRFVREILVERCQIREVLIGQNFRFGSDRSGSVELLERLGVELGFNARGLEPVLSEGEAISSSRIRLDLAAGRIGTAWKLLGRPPIFDGRVFTGERMGRKLGFPTLNVAVDNELVPGHGVYVTAVHIPSFGRIFASVTNVGVRPTVYENYDTTVESHLLDFTADVYKEDVRLYFFERLRDEMTFNSTMQLVAQIRRDVENARSWFAQHPLEGLPLPLRGPAGVSSS